LTSFGSETSSAINASGMELYKFIVLIGQSLAQGHGISISRTGICRGAGKVGASIAARGEYGILGPNPMQGPIFHIQIQDTHDRRSIFTH
jgi:hypothetical protein